MAIDAHKMNELTTQLYREVLYQVDLIATTPVPPATEKRSCSRLQYLTSRNIWSASYSPVTSAASLAYLLLTQAVANVASVPVGSISAIYFAKWAKTLPIPFLLSAHTRSRISRANTQSRLPVSLQTRGYAAGRVEARNIDTMQSGKAEIVSLDIVRSRASPFIDDPNLLNVALTRARQDDIILMHSDSESNFTCLTPIGVCA